MQGTLHKVNPARATTWFVDVTIYCTIFQNQFTSTSPVFTQQNTFEKKKLGKFLIEWFIDFQLRGPGPPGRTCTPIPGYFHDKTKISKENLRVDYHL